MLQKIGKVINAFTSAFLSRKLFMALVGIWMIYGVYWGAVQQLYTFEKPEQIVAFTQFTNYMMWGTTTIALWYIGVQAAANFKNNFSFASLLQTNQSVETIHEITEITEKVDPRVVEEFAAKYAGDISYRPILPFENTEEVWR